MARLIVEEGGRTRRFRLNEGTMTIGSGAEATLTLESDRIAAVHAELEFREGRAVLRLRPGVAPITVQGRKLTGGEAVLRPGSSARIGDALLKIERDDAAAAAGTGKKATGAKPGHGAASRSVVDSPRRTMKRGPSVPSWLIVVGFLAGAAGVYAVLNQFSKDVAKGEFSPQASDDRIKKALETGDFLGALRELDEKVDKQEGLDAEWKKVFEGHRKEALRMQAESTQEARNVLGNKYLQSQLENYVDGYLKEVRRPQARVLMKRIALFRGIYPTHPKLEWCERMEDRYGPIADMASPPTFEDVDWEVNTLTWAKPENYREAFAVMRAFGETADEADRAKVEALMKIKEKEQGEYFTDRMEQARYLWENKKEYGQSIEELVQLVIKLSDQSLIDQAAARIVSSPGIENALEGYKHDRPADFRDLNANAIVHAFCVEKGLVD